MNGEGSDRPACPSWCVLRGTDRPIKCSHGKDHVGDHTAYLIADRLDGDKRITAQVVMTWRDD